MAEITNEMIEAGRAALPICPASLLTDAELGAIYLAMSTASPQTDQVERVARAISGAAYDYMRSIGFSGGWDHDELGRTIAVAALQAIEIDEELIREHEAFKVALQGIEQLDPRDCRRAPTIARTALSSGEGVGG